MTRFFIRMPPPAVGKYLVIDYGENYIIAQNGLNRVYVGLKNHVFHVGDYLHIQGEVGIIKFSNIEGEFDFAGYLHTRGVDFEIYDASVDHIFLWPIRIRSVIDRFLVNFEGDTRTYISALLFGIRDYEQEVFTTFTNLHLMHLLSASGMLVYGLLNLIRKALECFLPEQKAHRFAYLFLIPWLIFNITSIVLWRLLLGVIINICNDRYFHKSLSYWNRKGILGIILLIVSRYIVNSPSFYLSFGLSLFLYIDGDRRQDVSFKVRIYRKLKPWLLLGPYIIATYGSFNLVGLLLFIPVMYVNTLILLLGLMQLYTMPIPIILTPLVRLNSLLLEPSNWMTLTINFGVLSIVGIVVFYILIMVHTHARQLRLVRYKSIATTALITFVIFTVLPLENLYDQGVYFINVGQGDAILIRNRRQAALIDTGGSLYKDIAAISLVPFLRKQRINKLDTVFITHDDFDHNGALPSLKQSFPVNEVVTDKFQTPLNRVGIDFYNLNTMEYDEDNAQSLVIYFSFMNHNWLMMGDAPIPVEQEIIATYPDLDVDILKIGHHGSNTSTCDELLVHTSPQEAIISVGRNYYGHPHSEVIARLEAHGIRIRRTDQEGTITYARLR